MKKYKIAIIGATGLVGQKIVQILFEEHITEKADLILYCSEKNANSYIDIFDTKLQVKKLDSLILKEKIDIALFATNEEVSKKWSPLLAKNGAFVIDNSSAFRKNKIVPLVVPEINSHLITSSIKIISNPNCSTIQLALPINELSKIYEIEKIIVSTYQSVSGAGKNALLDLKYGKNNIIKENIRENVISYIGKIDDKNFCLEENKMMFELKKIISKPFTIYASCVRVPIPYCHTESVYVKFKQKIDIEKISKVFDKNYLKLDEKLSLPTDVTDTNLTHISRIRVLSDDEIMFFVTADNLRRGAAYNAVIIAKIIIEKIFNKN